MTDPIADMLTRIRNAQVVRKPSVLVPYSKLKYNLAVLLQKEGYVKEVTSLKDDGNRSFSIQLKYGADGDTAIHSIKRISKPGRRVYSGKKTLPYVLNNFGLAVVSTSKGLLTNKQARKNNLGGEIICEIY